MKFQKGRGKTGGRKPGTPNKATLAVKAFAQSILEDPAYREKLKRRLMAGVQPERQGIGKIHVRVKWPLS